MLAVILYSDRESKKYDLRFKIKFIMKSFVYRLFVILAILLIASFLIWAFTLHGTGGLFHVDGTFHIALIIFGVLGLVLFGLVIWQFRLNQRRSFHLKKWLSVPILILTVTGVIIPASGFIYLNVDFSSPMSSPAPQLILSDNTSSNGIPYIAIVRYTPTTMQDFLIWGTGNTSNSLFEDELARQHVFMLRDLEPDRQYWYQINHGTTYYFKTPDAKGQSLHFAASGDAHFGAGDSRPDLTSKMLAQISEPVNSFDYFFSLGDLVEYGFADSQWQEAMNALSPMMSAIPTGLLPGNHDAILTGLSRYEYYCYPTGVDLQSGSQLWHRIDAGNIHFLMLDIEWSAESYTRAQADWLEEQLKNIPAGDWKIVLCHGFFYASGHIENGWKWYDNPETIGPLVPLFEKYGVNLVLGGHDHHMELLQKSGVTYAICGSFGGIPDITRTYTSPFSQWYASGQYGFLDVTLNENRADVVFRDPDFNELKRFNIPKP